jgi:hypothetical protein
MDLESFIQRLLYMRNECTDKLLDQNIIQDDINIYNRIAEKRKTIIEILEELKKFQGELADSAALRVKFTGTTIL